MAEDLWSAEPGCQAPIQSCPPRGTFLSPSSASVPGEVLLSPGVVHGHSPEKSRPARSGMTHGGLGRELSFQEKALLKAELHHGDLCVWLKGF